MCILFCPAPNVIVGMPWRTVQLASSPPWENSNLEIQPKFFATDIEFLTTWLFFSNKKGEYSLSEWNFIFENWPKLFLTILLALKNSDLYALVISLINLIFLLLDSPVILTKSVTTFVAFPALKESCPEILPIFDVPIFLFLFIFPNH